MRIFRAFSLILIASIGCVAQTPVEVSRAAPSAQLSAPDVNQTCLRLVQLMEAGGVAIADLQRAAAPIIANVRQACGQLQLRPAAGQPTFALMNNVRAYLELADAIPKPFPFPDVARDQFRESRDLLTRLDAHFRALLESKDAELRSPDPDNLSRYREENRLLPLPKTNGRRVVFLGDSVTNQWRLNEYFPDEDFINRGIDGQRTGQLLARLKSDVLDLRPVAVVIQGGSFDLTRSIPLTTIEDNYLLLAEVAAANNLKVILTSVLPVHDYFKGTNPTYERTLTRPPTFIRALNDWIKALCAQRGYTFADFTPALLDPKGFLAEDASDDGFHPNSRGYRLMAPVMAQAIEQATRPPVRKAPAAPAPITPVKPSKQGKTSNSK